MSNQDRLTAALEYISGPNWSVFPVDSDGAWVAAQIISEMQALARSALSGCANGVCECDRKDGLG